jgi:hypothetical protein
MNFRALVFDSEEQLDTNSYTQQATTIGRQLIDEMLRYKFDANINPSNPVVRLEDLTSCGPGSGEVYPTWTDMDDFHGSVFTSPAPGAAVTSATPPCLVGTEGYTVRVGVTYVYPDNPTVATYNRTWAKRIDLVISNKFSDDTVRMSYVRAF